MRKEFGRVLTVLLAACGAMVAMMMTAPGAMHLGNKWVALAVAATLMIGAITLFGLAEQRRPEKNSPLLWGVCYLLNSVANGFSLAAFYIHAKVTVTAADLLPGTLPAMGVVALAALLCGLRRKRLALWMTGFLTAALVVTSFIPAMWPVGFPRSAVLFSALAAAMYLAVYGVTIGRGERPVLRDVAYGSFGALIVITFVVLLIISEGEALEGLDVGGDIHWPWQKKGRRP